MAHDEKRLAELNAITRMMGKALAEEMADKSSGPPIGFALFCFDFGPDGFLSYVSNASREDVTRMLREHLERMEAGTDDTGGKTA